MANQKKQTTESKETKQQQAQAMVDDLMKKSLAAFEKLRYYSQEQVDKICQAMALAAEEHHMDLAVDAAKETGRGVAEDKAIKNIYASEYIWNNIRHDKTVGIIEDNDEDQTVTIADPLGSSPGSFRLLTQRPPRSSSPSSLLRRGTRSSSPSTRKHCNLPSRLLRSCRKPLKKLGHQRT